MAGVEESIDQTPSETIGGGGTMEMGRNRSKW